MLYFESFMKKCVTKQYDVATFYLNGLFFIFKCRSQKQYTTLATLELSGQEVVREQKWF